MENGPDLAPVEGTSRVETANNAAVPEESLAARYLREWTENGPDLAPVEEPTEAEETPDRLGAGTGTTPNSEQELKKSDTIINDK